MIQLIATHEVDDVEHWFNSPKRAELLEPLGMKATAFRDPEGDSNVVAVHIEAPDMETFQAALAGPEAQEAMKYDGVRAETLTIVVAG